MSRTLLLGSALQTDVKLHLHLKILGNLISLVFSCRGKAPPKPNPKYSADEMQETL